MRTSPPRTDTNSNIIGLVNITANPCFWTRGLSTGSAMALVGHQGGLVLAGALRIGHWSADNLLVNAGHHRVYPNAGLAFLIVVPEDNGPMRNLPHSFWGILLVTFSKLHHNSPAFYYPRWLIMKG